MQMGVRGSGEGTNALQRRTLQELPPPVCKDSDRPSWHFLETYYVSGTVLSALYEFTLSPHNYDDIRVTEAQSFSNLSVIMYVPSGLAGVLS